MAEKHRTSTWGSCSIVRAVSWFGTRNGAVDRLICGPRPPLWSHQQDKSTRGTKWFALNPKGGAQKHHYSSTWSSSLALVKYVAMAIKIIVQTDGLTVAQSRRCLDHSVGGAITGESGMCRGGNGNYPGNGTVGNHLHISGHGGSGTAFCSPAFLPVK